MPDIKIGDNTLTGVSELQCVNADDTTQHVVFYSAPRAILAVTAPAGSTIDVLQNSIVLQTYTLGAAETSHSFKVDVSTTNYVVRATLLDKVKNKTVAVTAATTYNITIKYGRLPDEYTELEYIESSGTQYIDTGYIPTVNPTILRTTSKWYANNYSGDMCVLGSRTGTGAGTGYKLPNLYNGEVEIQGINAAGSTTIGSTLYQKIHIFEAEIKSGQTIIRLDGESIFTNSTQGTATTPYSLLLLAINHQGTKKWYFRGKVYFCTIWDNNVIVRDFVPARRDSNSVVGMYDMVTNTLFTNAGSGSFIAGPEV